MPIYINSISRSPTKLIDESNIQEQINSTNFAYPPRPSLYIKTNSTLNHSKSHPWRSLLNTGHPFSQGSVPCSSINGAPPWAKIVPRRKRRRLSGPWPSIPPMTGCSKFKTKLFDTCKNLFKKFHSILVSRLLRD